MSKILPSAAALAGLTLGLAVLPSTAIAQRATPSQIIVYGTDPCPRTTDDEIVICYRKPESERFRIPEDLRQGGSLQSRQTWTKQAEVLARAGATGIGSCSAVGPGGFTGCTQQQIDQAFRERREQVATETAPE